MYYGVRIAAAARLAAQSGARTAGSNPPLFMYRVYRSLSSRSRSSLLCRSWSLSLVFSFYLFALVVSRLSLLDGEFFSLFVFSGSSWSFCVDLDSILIRSDLNSEFERIELATVGGATRRLQGNNFPPPPPPYFSNSLRIDDQRTATANVLRQLAAAVRQRL